MKTSKIIFISLLSTIALLIFIAFADIRINSHRISDINVYFNKTIQVLPSFKVISMNNSNNVTLCKSDSCSIEITYLKDSKAPRVNYIVKADTLYLTDLRSLNVSNVSLRIKTTDVLEKVLLRNSMVDFENYNFKNLNFDLDNSQVAGGQDDKLKAAMHSIGITAKNHSDFGLSDFSVDSLHLVFQKSTADLMLNAKKACGSLSDSSRVNLRQSAEISLKKDPSSNINIGD
jgi:hypothetical protein